MNPEQQNKTIAKHCGWRQSKSSMWEGWWHQKGKHTYQRFCPDYCNDLNAMHEAENSMKIDDLKHYQIMLCDWLEADWGRASASTRAEAFLRTLNLWEDEP